MNTVDLDGHEIQSNLIAIFRMLVRLIEKEIEATAEDHEDVYANFTTIFSK